MAKLQWFVLSIVWGCLVLNANSSNEIGSFRNTYYYVSFENDFGPGVLDSSIKNMAGDVLAWTTSVYKKSLNLEGSGVLRDGRVVNYAGRIDGEIRYRVTPSPWGNGVKACDLVPFRTVAVDPGRVPQGSLVYLPDTKGMKLPDGTLHDGYWRADDIGGAIQKDRVDLFIGKRAWASYLDQAQITHLKPLKIFLVEYPSPDSCVNREVDENPGGTGR